jgi:3-isopropylmalate/(R)-2-methylmalate dehydratase small subunit
MIISGPVLPIPHDNVDTDQIIPARHLTTIDDSGMGEFCFTGMTDGRKMLDAHPGAVVWVAGENVGCGSSREHAAWALLGAGIKAVISPSFARIFSENCYTTGLVPVIVDAALIPRFAAARTITIDVTNETVQADGDEPIAFALDPARKPFLLGGGFLKYLNGKIPAIRAWEAQRAS